MFGVNLPIYPYITISLYFDKFDVVTDLTSKEVCHQ